MSSELSGIHILIKDIRQVRVAQGYIAQALRQIAAKGQVTKELDEVLEYLYRNAKRLEDID